LERRDPPYTYLTATARVGELVRRWQNAARVLWVGLLVLVMLSSIPLGVMIRNEINYEELTRGSVIDRRDSHRAEATYRCPEASNRNLFVSLAGGRSR
jgi:hypothetical protein